MPVPPYACPLIDNVIDQVKDCLKPVNKEFNKHSIEDLEDIYENWGSLANSDWEDTLEKVRSICEQLREMKGNAEQEASDALDSLVEANERIEELEFQIKQLTK